MVNQDDCEHDIIKRYEMHREYCETCGAIFEYCHECTLSGDTDSWTPIYHMAPICERK